MTVCRKKIGPISGMSPSTGIGDRSNRGGVLSDAALGASTWLNMKLVRPMTSTLSTTPTMTWSTKYLIAKRPSTQRDEQAGDHRGDQAGPGRPGQRADHGGGEGAEEQLAVDGDVDHARALAEHAARGRRRRAGRRAASEPAEQADDGDGAAGGGPGQEAGHPGEREDDRPARAGSSSSACTGRSAAAVHSGTRPAVRTHAVARRRHRDRRAAAMKSLGAASRNVVSPSCGGEEAAISARPMVSTPNMTGALRSTTVTSGRLDLVLSRRTGCHGRARWRAHWASLAGRRKIARISGGAAMNSTISDWTTSTMSTGMFCEACIAKPPALNAPNSRPAPGCPAASSGRAARR